MNRWTPALYFGLCLYAGRALELNCANGLAIGGVAPAWCSLLGCCCIAMGNGPYRFLWLGLAGLTTDLTGPGRVGLGMALGLLIGYALVRWFGPRRASPLAAAIGTGAAVASMHFLRGLVDSGIHAGGLTWTDGLAWSAAVGLYTGLAAWPLAWGWQASLRSRGFRRLKLA